MKKWLDNLLRSIYNLYYYRKVIMEDKDTDYIYILKILKIKLEKTYNYWGNLTDYENDYHDKEKLKELINQIDEFMKTSFEKSESVNKKECSALMAKVGRLIPNLWT
jgi:hypothetical protein